MDSNVDRESSSEPQSEDSRPSTPPSVPTSSSSFSAGGTFATPHGITTSAMDPSLSSDTPRSHRQLASGNVPSQRDTCAAEMASETGELDINSFLIHYAPSNITEDELQRCINALKLKSKLNSGGDVDPLVTDKNQFRNFQQKPSMSGEREEATFRPLTDICDVISKRDVLNRTVSCALVQHPNSTTKSEITGSSHKVDGFFVVKRSTLPHGTTEQGLTMDVAINCEWKKGSSADDKWDNRSKVASAAAHAMNNDAARNHMYSITIEDSRMSIWYWSRSHSVKSTSFDFTKNVELTVKVFATFLYATMAELGYSESVKRGSRIVAGKKELCLIVKVEDRYYMTHGRVSEHLTAGLTGRATRVWRAVEVVSFDDWRPKEGARTQILKQAWLDCDAKTEQDIQKCIFDHIERVAEDFATGSAPEHFRELDDDDKKHLGSFLSNGRFKRHFLTIVGDERGSSSKECHNDVNFSTNVFAQSVTPDQRARQKHSDPARLVINPTYHVTTVTSPAPSPPRAYKAKFPYYVVYDEVCEALHHVKSRATVFRAMIDCAYAIELMFLANWVHRDISSGNLLWFQPKGEAGRGILSDLEYAKEFNAEGRGSPEAKTGTPYFMAVEIENQNSIYSPSDAMTAEDYKLWQSVSQSTPRMVHNFQHDVESFFWLLVWKITHQSRLPELKRYGETIFSGHKEHVLRGTYNYSASALPLLVTVLQAHAETRLLANSVDFLRYTLLDGYRRRGFMFGKRDTYSQLYCELRKTLKACLGHVEGEPDLIEDGPSPPPVDIIARRKRMLPVDQSAIQPWCRGVWAGMMWAG